jgi:SHS2 domain-containing protein
MGGDVVDAAPNQQPEARGHQLVEHTADVILVAWAPTLAEVIEELVAAFVSSTVSIPHHPATVTGRIAVGSNDPVRAVIDVLEEVLLMMDAEGRVPAATKVTPTDVGLTVRFETTALDDTEQIGSVPKGVARSDLQIEPRADAWHARVTIDV